MSRLSCLHQAFARPCPDFRDFDGFSCVHVQILVRSPDLCAFPRLHAFKFRLCCVRQTFVLSPDFMHSCSDFRAFMFRLSCVHNQTFLHSSPDFRAFVYRLLCVHVQTIMHAFKVRQTALIHNLFTSN